MNKQVKTIGKLSLKNELSKSELKAVTGGTTQQTYCSSTTNPFPVPGSTPIGCNPGYCQPTGHGNFLYCA